MSRRYWVDWSDSAFPQIRPESSADECQELLTLTEAKRGIREHCENEIAHWRIVARQTRALRAVDVWEGKDV